MKYGLVSIDYGSVNLGNRLIEYALKELLDLGEPAVKVSMFSVPTEEQIEQLGACDFVLLPGSTILSKGPGQSLALQCLPQIKAKCPVFCVGASGWAPDHPYYTEIMSYITPPIGVRDPETEAACKTMQAETVLTGCPTLFLPDKVVQPPKSPYTIIGFARDGWDWQDRFFNGLSDNLVAALQEPEVEYGLARRHTGETFDYEDPGLVMDRYAGCEAVYTGRLHGILPAMSQDKPVCFFGHKRDSRFSLLECLGIPINPIHGDVELRLMKSKTYDDAVQTLWENFNIWGVRVGLL